MDLLSDLKGLVRSDLATKGIAHDPNADVRTLLHLALNHELKNVLPKPRQVLTSPEFDQKRLTLDAPKQQALADILA